MSAAAFPVSNSERQDENQGEDLSCRLPRGRSGFVMRNINLWNLQNCTGGKLHNAESVQSREISCIVTDSRRVRENCLFICIAGNKVDGHDFAEAAVENGALAVVCERPFPDSSIPYLLVESTFQATKDIAEYYRSQLDTKIIGVTGSAGKTTTKEMIAAVLAGRYKVSKTKGNLNNEWGVPYTIFDIKEDDNFAVIEMGTNHPGELDRIAKVAKPDIVVITNIGLSHKEFFGDRDGVFKEKTSVFNYLPPYGIVILNGDDDKLAGVTNAKGIHPDFFGFEKKNDIFAENFTSRGLDGCSFNIVFRSTGGRMTMHVDLPVPGKQMVYNALAATLLATKLKVAPLQIKKALENFSSGSGRNHIIRTDKFNIIDDAYNASPDSMAASLNVLATVKGRKVAVLGDMFELGEDSEKLHFKTGQLAGKTGADVIICIGTNSEKTSMGAKMTTDNPVKYYPTVSDCLEQLGTLLKQGDTILVKASHSMQFEKIVDYLKEM